MSRIKMLKEIKEEAESLATSIGNFLISIEDESVDKKEEKKISIEEVRKILADKSRLGHTKEIRELLSKYGAKKLSEIDPSNYKSLLKDVGEIK
ncbi:hypothetical protein [Helcococcus massiliensis]|uniref:hypothetical protein n=1 Tax=Helcococcus massiliensis TaxID=2040290 RepID=UPI000CDF032D|nr:hypothetical protein [Helcococcus massiliensis]